MTKLNLPHKFVLWSFCQRIIPFRAWEKELKRSPWVPMSAASFHPPDPPPSLSLKPSDKEANHWRLNVSNSFSKPGSNVTVIIPPVISMKACKHLQMEECCTYNLGMYDAAVYLMEKKKKPVMFIGCPSCSKTTPLMVKLKKLVRNRKVLSTPWTCENHSLHGAVGAVSRVCCCLRLCLLGQMQPKANKMIYHLTALNLMICNCRMKYLYEFPTSPIKTVETRIDTQTTGSPCARLFS